MKRALAEGTGVLVHCFAGRSRSATLIIAFLMETQSLTLTEAAEKLKSKRPEIKPNMSFVCQVRFPLEASLRGVHDLTPTSLSQLLKHEHELKIT
jgi:protein phosphatase slingshot